jgi:shikimate kinase
MHSVGQNIILIGMPGAGKSTVGVVLAKLTQRDFVDTDVLIQQTQGTSLQAILDAHGYRELRAVEERVILGFSATDTVVATGGSAVYSEAAIRHLQASGPAVFLDVTVAELQRRVHDLATRGIAGPPGQTFSELCAERRVLYERYADITIPCTGLDHDQVAAAVAAAVD